MTDQELTHQIIGGAIEVDRQLGPGLLESAYEVCLAHVLNRSGLRVERQVALPVVFDGEKLDAGYRIDLWVERRVVLELKSVDAVSRLHEAQLLTYLRLSKCPIGLLINFNVLKLTDGVMRRVMDYRG